MSSGARIRFLEACYDILAPEKMWLEGLCATAPAAFGFRGDAVIVALIDATRNDWIDIRNLAFHGVPADLARGLFTTPGARPGMPGAEQLVQNFRRVWLGSVWTGLPNVPALLEYYSGLLSAHGLDDILAVNTTDPTYHGCFFCFPGQQDPGDRTTANSWRRLKAHVAAAHRLRRSIGGLIDAQDPRETAEARLTLSGQPEMLSEPTASASAREALRRALRRIELARKLGEHDGDTALELWRALVAGRWSLIETFEASGRRYYLAYKNDPELAAERRLSRREQQVCTFAAQGYSNKLIAYSLGLSESTVATLLRRARTKLGPRADATMLLGRPVE